ncbi:MAG TPA: ABC transporter permease [Gammaproteobacteria bacterium]|jgi:ABC-2 type transport system permease protein
MSTRLPAQIVKELLSYLRDPKSRLTLVGPPLMQLLIFSYAVTLDVNNVDLVVLDEDAGRGSHELIQRLQGAGFVNELSFVDDAHALAAAIDRREALAALHFPADFSRELAAGRPAVAQVVLDGRRANAAQITLGYLSAIAADTGAELARRGSGSAAPRTELRHWFNPNLIYRWFVVPSLSGILAMLISLLVTSLSIARERELGTFDQLLVSPATPLEIVIGKTVPALIIGSVLGTVMILAGVLLFRIPFTGSGVWLLGGLMLFILSMVGIGLMLSSICRTQQQAILGTFSIGVPLVLISGFATPVENMPDWLQLIAQASPLKYYLVIVRGSFLKALPSTDLLANMWPMLLIALVTLSSAVVIVKRNLQ